MLLNYVLPLLVYVMNQEILKERYQVLQEFSMVPITLIQEAHISHS